MAASAPKKTGVKQAGQPDSSVAAARAGSQSEAGAYADLLTLQNMAGNRAVNQLVGANRMSRSSEGDDIPPIVYEVLNTSGQPLDTATQAEMEAKFSPNLKGISIANQTNQLSSEIRLGQQDDDYEQHAEYFASQTLLQQSSSEHRETGDFRNVRIHTDAQAIESARSVDADAYTVGNHIVFNEGQYASGTSSGKKLLAHELSHVIQQSPILRKQPAKTKTQGSQQELGGGDYAKARGLIDTYYLVLTNLLTDVYLNANNAIHLFGIYSGIKDKEGEEPPMATIKFVLELVPQGDLVLDTLKLVENLKEVSDEVVAFGEKVAGEVGNSAKTPDAQEVTGEALGQAIMPYLAHKQAVIDQYQKDISFLDSLEKDPTYRGKLAQTIAGRLGPTPRYDAKTIVIFGVEYELQLYKDYYLKVAWIDRHAATFLNPYTSYAVKNVPSAAQSRILKLHEQLGHIAKVAIATSWAGEDQEKVEIVKILLSWGVRLGYEGVDDFKIHTGDDLKMPYRGERYEEAVP